MEYFKLLKEFFNNFWIIPSENSNLPQQKTLDKKLGIISGFIKTPNFSSINRKTKCIKKKKSKNKMANKSRNKNR